MNRRFLIWLFWLVTAGALYFFENNTGTRTMLCCTCLFLLIPAVRRLLFFPGRAEAPVRRSVTVRTFSYPEEEEAGDVRPYQPGDPVNRMHWKLSAKRNEWLIRKTAAELTPEETRTEGTAAGIRESAGRKKKKAILICLSLLLLMLLCLLLIPAARLGAQTLCNRLFAASEQVNDYIYDRFPVPAEQPVGPAVLILAVSLALLIGLLFLSGSRLLALAVAAGCAVFQMYFGLAFPGWLNVLLFAAFALWMIGRVPDCREALILLGTVLAVSLAVAVVYPGVDAATETASERARDFLSRMSQQVTGAVREAPEGENEVRRANTQSLIQGEREAGAAKEYRLETIEEEQISMPRWINYLKIILLLLAVIILLILPFLPFLWLNSRRKKAQEVRSVFASENVREAVCAIFRQTVAWLEAMGLGAGNLLYRDWAQHLPDRMRPGFEQRFSQCAALFEEAAYSDHAMAEDQRQQVLSLLDETQEAMLARADWKQKMRLKYGECLWTEEP